MKPSKFIITSLFLMSGCNDPATMPEPEKSATAETYYPAVDIQTAKTCAVATSWGVQANKNFRIHNLDTDAAAKYYIDDVEKRIGSDEAVRLIDQSISDIQQTCNGDKSCEWRKQDELAALAPRCSEIFRKTTGVPSQANLTTITLSDGRILPKVTTPEIEIKCSFYMRLAEKIISGEDDNGSDANYRLANTYYDTVLMAQTSPYIAYLSQKNIAEIPRDRDELINKAATTARACTHLYQTLVAPKLP